MTNQKTTSNTIFSTLTSLLTVALLFATGCVDGEDYGLTDADFGDVQRAASLADTDGDSEPVYTMELFQLDASMDRTFDAYQTAQDELRVRLGARVLVAQRSAPNDVMPTVEFDRMQLVRWPSAVSLERYLDRADKAPEGSVTQGVLVKLAHDEQLDALQQMPGGTAHDGLIMWSLATADSPQSMAEYTSDINSVIDVAGVYGAESLSTYRTVEVLEGDMAPSVVNLVYWPSTDALQMFKDEQFPDADESCGMETSYEQMIMFGRHTR